MIKQSVLPSAAQCPSSLELDLLLATLIQRPGSRRSGEESFGAIFKDDHYDHRLFNQSCLTMYHATGCFVIPPNPTVVKIY